MAVFVSELIRAREAVDGDRRSRRRTFAVWPAADETGALLVLEAMLPLREGPLFRQRMRASQEGHQFFLVEVEYADRQPNREGREWQFTTSAERQRIFQSLQTVLNLPQAADHEGAIGVQQQNGELAVEGTEILVPVHRWSEKRVIPPAQILNTSFRKALTAAVGTVNARAWRGFGPGEVLFTGWSGRVAELEETATVQFSFAYSPTVRNFRIGQFQVPEKQGWDYLWVRYDDAEAQGLGQLLKRPVEVHVERVYRRTDFQALGL